MAEGNGNGNGSNNRVMVVGALVGIAFAIVGAMITFFVNTSSLSQEAATLSTRVTSLEQNYNKLYDRNTVMITDIAAQEAALKEIETQFCGEDIIRNMSHANDQRNVALLWKKVFDTDFQTGGDYYPHICNRLADGSVGSRR